MKQKEITRERIRNIGVFDDTKKWIGEVNIVSWNGADPKVDLRYWSEDYIKCSSGLALPLENARLLGEILVRLSDDVIKR